MWPPIRQEPRDAVCCWPSRREMDPVNSWNQIRDAMKTEGNMLFSAYSVRCWFYAVIGSVWKGASLLRFIPQV